MKKKVKKHTPQTDVKETTYNFFYNIIIFILSVFIVYLGYSAYLKIIHYPVKKNYTDTNEKASEKIQVDIFNGCGVSGVADRYKDYLRAHDFDVINTGNYKTFDVDETFIIDRIGNKQNALKLARTLGIAKAKIVKQINEDYFLDVSLIIGKDYDKLKPLTGGD